MKLSNAIKIQITTIFMTVLGFIVFIFISLFTPWYVALILITAGVFATSYYIKKQPELIKKMISENFFMIISGLSALAIIIFVIYLLLHIFLLGKSHLTLEFLFSEPTEGLTEGGIFPAIIGTALLVIIMSIAGVPIGTITAIYLTEYARENSIISKIIRFAVNTLSGVPAIVFGLFGLGFFIGIVGQNMDNFENNAKKNNMIELFNQKNSPFFASGKATALEIKEYFTKSDSSYWSYQIDLTKAMVEMDESKGYTKEEAVQYFSIRTKPKWGQPALIWAALTMALLTLPVVIVSVEEAIKTVPKDLREASLALGATKFKTILKVVLPGSITGILTGGILAVSRGAGEVAPILFTGAAYYLPDLPNSLTSQFMELGYHIYVLTTQSTNVEATKPLQYATTFILLILTFALNFSAIFLRSKVRAKLTKQGY